VLRPGWLATIATVIAVAAIERSASGVVVGLVGALVGGLASVAASQFGLLASVLVVRVSVQRLVVGIGPRLADWSTPHRVVVLRAIPILLAVSVRATRQPVRKRIWASALCAAVFEVGLAAVAVRFAAGPFTHGFAAATVAALCVSLIPKRTAASTSTGWLLFRLPWVSDDLSRQMEAAPVVGKALEAAQAGELATAERLAAQLRETYPDLRSALAARISVLEAQGRYAEAMILAVKLTTDMEQEPQEAAVSYAALAGLTCATVEAGQLESELGLSTASQAIENAATLGYPSYKLNGVRALHALLSGKLDEAITLARLAAGAGDDLLARADDLATLARAHMASGDNRTARQVLSEAEKLASWWPRVVGTRTRLEVAS
jgi:hypothetical protein